VTADPAGQELNIGERVDYTRAHLPAAQRERYEQELRGATERALDTGEYGPLGRRGRAMVAGGAAGGPRRVLLAAAEAPGRGGPLG
jgi:plasmid stabilization system protein ParE